MHRFAHGLIASLVLAPGCARKEAPPAAVAVETESTADADLGTDPLVEQQDDGTLAWRIDPDGQVRAAASTSAGARIKQDLGGTLVYKVEGGEPTTVPL